ncbi:cupin domain-containing protein [Paucibacter sp. R3-3]|uniref:Cupin domain-containing protein n=1 Tax=Roseateles agri TaxID=3098619 RepID=A0ABU5DT88_9BURK|nr:cupin domain-containing protein [Paucibacter sp. R3-3]MDY0749040.1 cupin domain-containing protein [Paucibacter sp. R3-3]
MNKPFRLTAVTVTMMAAAALLSPRAGAHDAGEETVTPVQRKPLPDMPGKQLILAVVAYAPGQASAAHFHPGSVFAYVLEGEVVSQLEGEPERVYKTGESWYEPPRKPHLVSRNASTTKPARLLAVLLGDEGGPVKVPLEK